MSQALTLLDFLSWKVFEEEPGLNTPIVLAIANLQFQFESASCGSVTESTRMNGSLVILILWIRFVKVEHALGVLYQYWRIDSSFFHPMHLSLSL